MSVWWLLLNFASTSLKYVDCNLRTAFLNIPFSLPYKDTYVSTQMEGPNIQKMSSSYCKSCRNACDMLDNSG